MVKASAADVAKNFGHYREVALTEPVVVQRYSRDSVVILSAREYERLSKLDRRVVAIEELSRPDMDKLARSRMDEEHKHLDALLGE